VPDVPATLVALVALCLGACGGAPSAPQTRPVARVLVVGADGLEWSVLRPLLQDGHCPNLRRLMEAGSFGKLATLDVTLSPVVWTSIATGKLPKDHGILEFLDPEGREYTSSRRAVRALWNIADRYGLSTDMFGWFVTWPVEPVRGVAVSGSSSSALIDQNWKPALLDGVEGQVHPPDLTARVMAIAERAGTRERVLELAREEVYGELPEGLLDAEQERIRQQTLWSIQADATFYELARTLFEEHPADLNLVYLGGTDVVGHRYWRQHEPEAYAWQGDPAADAALAGVIPRYYEWFDEMLGGLLEAVGPDVTVLVLSDHGMHAIATDAPNEFGTTGHHLGGISPGVIVAAGPGIAQQGDVDYFLRTGGLATHGSVVDVAPTVLALLGIPAGRDMAGRAYRPILAPGPALENAKLPPVETHDTGFRPPELVTMPAEMGENFKEKFGQLGYLALDPTDGEARVVVPDDEDPAPADAAAPADASAPADGAEPAPPRDADEGR
jgi:hypothetical protein